MTVADPQQLSIEALEAACIDPDTFDHEAHVYVGWLYLQRFPLLDAIQKCCDALRRLTAKLGAPEKYHETVTWFFLLLIADRRATSASSNWLAFRRNNRDLIREGGKLLARYYSQELLASERAKQHFVLPDKLAH